MKQNSHIRHLLRPAKTKKYLSVAFREADYDMISMLSVWFSSESGKHVSKTQIVEEAVQAFIESSLDFIMEQRGYEFRDSAMHELEAVSNRGTIDTAVYNTVIVPMLDNEQYRKTWFQDCIKDNVRIQERKLRQMKYIAAYVGAPTSGIETYAQITAWEKDPNHEGRFLIRFTAPRPLPNAIEIKDPVEAAGMRSVRYTCIDLLRNALVISDLFPNLNQ